MAQRKSGEQNVHNGSFTFHPLADQPCTGLGRLGQAGAGMIRIDAIWLAVEPADMRAGMDSMLVRVVRVFGAAHPHHAYVFANRRANRLKVLVHDGVGIWLAARRLNEGLFRWPAGDEHHLQISEQQLQALVLGLPWQLPRSAGIITAA